jgi:hypothetical protein
MLACWKRKGTSTEAVETSVGDGSQGDFREGCCVEESGWEER